MNDFFEFERFERSGAELIYYNVNFAKDFADIPACSQFDIMSVQFPNRVVLQNFNGRELIETIELKMEFKPAQKA